MTLQELEEKLRGVGLGPPLRSLNSAEGGADDEDEQHMNMMYGGLDHGLNASVLSSTTAGSGANTTRIGDLSLGTVSQTTGNNTSGMNNTSLSMNTSIFNTNASTHAAVGTPAAGPIIPQTYNSLCQNQKVPMSEAQRQHMHAVLDLDDKLYTGANANTNANANAPGTTYTNTGLKQFQFPHHGPGFGFATPQPTSLAPSRLMQNVSACNTAGGQKFPMNLGLLDSIVVPQARSAPLNTPIVGASSTNNTAYQQRASANVDANDNVQTTYTGASSSLGDSFGAISRQDANMSHQFVQAQFVQAQPLFKPLD